MVYFQILQQHVPTKTKLEDLPHPPGCIHHLQSYLLLQTPLKLVNWFQRCSQLNNNNNNDNKTRLLSALRHRTTVRFTKETYMIKYKYKNKVICWKDVPWAGSWIAAMRWHFFTWDGSWFQSSGAAWWNGHRWQYWLSSGVELWMCLI